MDAVEFLDSDIVDLPKTRVGDYPAFMDRLLNDYRTQIQRVVNRRFIDRSITNELRRVDPLSTAIREVITLAIGGNRISAYNRLDVALRKLGAHLRALMPTGDMSRFINPIYRFRTAGPTPYPKGGLFHIPFYRRHIVGPMRYSIAGLPSLYLGGSTHVCWRELGEPDLATVAVSRFHAIENTNLRVLNFGHRLPVLAAYVANVPQDFTSPTNAAVMVAAQVACWPLIAACSIRVPDRTVPDRPEYLVPQLMLEWITRTHQFHGIRYFSTHYAEYPDDPKTYMNYVFPARTNPAVGYCPELCELFELTDPLSWAQAKAAPIAGVQRPGYKTRGVPDAALEAEFGGGRWAVGHASLAACERPKSVAGGDPLVSGDAGLRDLAERESPARSRSVHWFQAKAALGIPEDMIV